MQCEMFVGDMGATSVVPSLSAKGGSTGSLQLSAFTLEIF